MKITEVHVRLVRSKDEQLKAFCSMTLDNEFVVRDIKIIEGPHGYFIAMPSRKIGSRCGKCGTRNYPGATFCSGCGTSLPPDRVQKDPDGRPKLHADVAHPISSECRKRIQDAMIRAYEEERKKSEAPGHKSPADESDDRERGPTR
jgi:stage V sporulation protein G